MEIDTKDGKKDIKFGECDPIEFFRQCGIKGGSRKSAEKTAAGRRNLKKAMKALKAIQKAMRATK